MTLAQNIEASGKSNGAKTILQAIDEKTASKIKAICGIAPRILTPVISSDEIRHTFSRHGKSIPGKTIGERQKNQVPITADDIAKIPKIISTYDKIEKGSYNKREASTSVKFVKSYPNGVTYIVFLITDKLKYKTMWKKKQLLLANGIMPKPSPYVLDGLANSTDIIA